MPLVVDDETEVKVSQGRIHALKGRILMGVSSQATILSDVNYKKTYEELQFQGDSKHTHTHTHTHTHVLTLLYLHYN